ncbi:pyruvate-formate lyase [Anaerotaenia torta]|uniref:pyruvate formate lyase family protein n=1 Tax=Anaerotaenia torta TaxID=433293 RepID=UPI003D1CD3D7
MEKMADALKNISHKAPGSMLEALQLAWIYGIMSPLLQFGRMDVYLGDWYAHDIDNNIITEEEALEMLQSYFRQIDSLDSETDCRVIVGGYGRRNPENADRLCLVAAEACRTVKEILPQFTLRFNKDTPKEVWDACMRCIEEGRTFPLLYNDDVLVPGLMKAFHVDRARAESYTPLGCGEIEFDHYSFGTPSGSLNTLKILELVMRGGYDPIMDWTLIPGIKDLEASGTFGGITRRRRKTGVVRR